MWKHGLINIDGINYPYEAKVYDEPSKYGINGGRVSKLSVTNYWAEILLLYDRAWEEPPKDDLTNKILEAILELYK